VTFTLVLAGAPGTGALGADPGAAGAAAAPPLGPLLGLLALLVVDALAVSALLGPPAAAASDGSTAEASLSPAGGALVLDVFAALPEHPATSRTATALQTHLMQWL
jgi:hypothetical protein